MTTNFGINYSLLIQLTLMLLTIIKFKKFYMLEFDESFYEVPVTNTPIPSIKMYKNSSLSEDKMELLAQKIEDKLAEEKVFLNPDLTLEQFALMVNIPKHHVSQVLNVHFQKNFHRMIGEYRVKHAIEIMEKTNQNLKIESIVYDSGFNCTKAFAKYFKDLTGQQPSSYIKAFSINTSNNKISV